MIKDLFFPIGILPLWRDLESIAGMRLVVLSLLPISLLAWAFLPYAWRRGGRTVPAPVAVTMVAFVPGLAVSLREFVLAQRAQLGNLLGYGNDLSEAAHCVELSVANVIGASVLLAAVPLSAVLIARTARRAAGSRTLVIAVGVAAAMIVCAVAVGWLRVCSRWHAGALCLADMQSCARSNYEMSLGLYDGLDQSRLAIWVIAIVASIVVLLLPAKAEDNARSFVSLWPAIGGLALGLCLWIATRDRAYDAAHPLPLLVDPWGLVRSPVVPSARSGQELTEGPLLEVARGALLLDGHLLPDSKAVEETLVERRRLWEATMAGRTFPGRLSVAAPSDTPVALLAPILRSARIEGREHQTLLVRLPDRAANTCTLGTLARHPHYRELALPPETLESGVSTWGEVAARLDNASGPPAGSSR